MCNANWQYLQLREPRRSVEARHFDEAHHSVEPHHSVEAQGPWQLPRAEAPQLQASLQQTCKVYCGQGSLWILFCMLQSQQTIS